MPDCNHAELKTPYCPECGLPKRTEKRSLIAHLHVERERLRGLPVDFQEVSDWIDLVEKHLP